MMRPSPASILAKLSPGGRRALLWLPPAPDQVRRRVTYGASPPKWQSFNQLLALGLALRWHPEPAKFGHWAYSITALGLDVRKLIPEAP